MEVLTPGDGETMATCVQATRAQALLHNVGALVLLTELAYSLLYLTENGFRLAKN